MLVTFTTKSYADITMFGDVAVALLKMMGHSGTVPSAISAEDVPVALDRLKSAITAGKGAQETGGKEDEAVSTANRALPLINLLTSAAKEKGGVTWK